jgi:hypothetical protein
MWTAPAAGTGTLSLHLGVVDANGANDNQMARTDPLGDDVVVIERLLCEGAAACAGADLDDPTWERNEHLEADYRDASYGPGCAAAGRHGGWSGLALLAVVIAFAGRRRAWLLALLLVACSHDLTLPAECRDRICGDASAGPDPIDSGTPGCTEDWTCTSWEAPIGSDQATRTCTDRNMTGTTECKPSEGPVALPALDLNYFMCQVEPILDRGCGMQACHGTETGRAFRMYSRGRLRNDEIVNRIGTCIPATGTVNLAEAGSGTIMCEGRMAHTQAEWKKNFDSARSFMIAVSSPAESDMLLQPVVGGRPHMGVHLFTTADPDYQTIQAWLGGATQASCNPLPN